MSLTALIHAPFVDNAANSSAGTLQSGGCDKILHRTDENQLSGSTNDLH